MINNQNIITKNQQDRHEISFGARKIVFSTRTILIIIVIAATALRLFSALYQGNEVSDMPGIFDQISYDGLARRVVDGYGFSFAEGHWPATRAGEPTAHWSYLYTGYLIVVYKVFGEYPIIARVIQAIVVGIFQPLLTWRLGRRIFGQRVGLVAAALNAVYIYFFYYAGGLLTESFYITGILWTFDVAFRIVDAFWEKQTSQMWRKWVEFGFAIGFTVLLRQLFLLFLPFLFLWIWWNDRDEQVNEARPTKRFQHVIHWSAVTGLSIVVLILGLLITPWTIRNYRAFDTFVLLNTNAGFAFYWGNHPIHGTHFAPLLPVSYQKLIPPELLSLNEGKLDKALLQEGIQIVLDDPVRYVLLSFSRIKEYIKFWPTNDSELLSNISRVCSIGILLPFILLGLGNAFNKLRNSSYIKQKSYIFLLYLFIVIYTLIHLSTWTLIRYRLPIDALLLIFAAVSIDNLTKRVKNGYTSLQRRI